jgi:hypothetical protein
MPAPTADLLKTLGELYESEINAGVSSFWDDGVCVWLGDDLNGRFVERKFYRRDKREPGAFRTWPGLWKAAAEWLHEEAIQRYPRSEYAKHYVW